jgi:hypothetical protein
MQRLKSVQRSGSVKVDESATTYYMRRIMRLLLLLSALLTAMVGLGTPAVAAARPVCEVSVSRNINAEKQIPRPPALPPCTVGALDRVSFETLARTSTPSRAVPLYAERLRV